MLNSDRLELLAVLRTNSFWDIFLESGCSYGLYVMTGTINSKLTITTNSVKMYIIVKAHYTITIFSFAVLLKLFSLMPFKHNMTLPVVLNFQTGLTLCYLNHLNRYNTLAPTTFFTLLPVKGVCPELWMLGGRVHKLNWRFSLTGCSSMPPCLLNKHPAPLACEWHNEHRNTG